MQLDLTAPNTGRMIDYWLGGDHNFEIDRQLADQVSAAFPVAVQTTKESRELVGRCVKYFYAQGIRAIIDFGSSLPTCDNTHLVAHTLDPEIRVIYSDIDPITVAYAQDLLRGEKNVIYLQANAAHPGDILDSPLTRALLGDERRVGFVFLNLTHLLMDDELRSSWPALYEWAAPGSLLAMSGASEHWDSDPDLIAVRDSYRRANIASRFRMAAQMIELASPWSLIEEGVRLNADWGLPPGPAPSRIVGYSMMFRK